MDMRNLVSPATTAAGSRRQRENDPPPRILVVDDEPLLRQLYAEVLVDAGYKVDAAEDGAVAWDALQLNGYDLLITDQDMPKVTGIELLKQLYAARLTLPVIMATGTYPQEEFIHHPWLQPDATLLKPYSIAEFLGTVKEVLLAADNARIRVEKDFPVILQAISEIEPPPEEAADQPPALVRDGDIVPIKVLPSAPVQYLSNASQRILVVDDDNDTRRFSVVVLAGSGYDVDAVTDGAAGWEALQSYDYDLVVTDNQMPRMTGVEMIGKLRSANMGVPVIMATRSLPVNEFVRKPWLKPDAMLERPFSNDDLLATVKQVLHPDGGYDGGKATLLPKYL